MKLNTPAINAPKRDTFSTLLRCPRDLFGYQAQRNHRRLRHLLHLDVVPLHGWQILEHGVPFPTFHWIARLEPVLGAHHLRELLLAEAGVLRPRSELPRHVGADLLRGGVGIWQAE